MAQVNIRMDDDLKVKADKLFDDLGLNMTTAFNMFVKQAVRQKGIPFEVTADPFYSASNMNILKQSVREAEERKFVTKTLDELQAMADEN